MKLMQTYRVDDMVEKVVKIYTDGACKGNPGVGGWGCVLLCDGKQKNAFGGEANTTNNRMELVAVIKSLELLIRPCSVVLHSDSKYVLDGIRKWINGWVANGWRTSNGKPVKNKDLWVQVHTLSKIHTIEWVWVKGHSGDYYNELADTMANAGVKDMRKE